jgi:signal transduction histidine kinase
MPEKKKVNLLLVDDSEANLIAMRAILEDLDENLISVDSGKRALRTLLDQDFAVVLLDVDMPLIDGFEVATMMRQVQKLKHTPIIFLTALYQNESSVAKGYALGAVDYIFKPIEPEILKAKVRFFIELYRKSAEITEQAELLRETNRRLDDLNLNLERRVDERTAQLETAVADLEREITERKLIERERERLLHSEQAARADAERANRLKDEFLATISHELRTPLNSILGWIKILNEGADTETAERALEVIDRNARVQAQLVEDILDISRTVSGKLPLQLETADPKLIVEAVIETVRPTLTSKQLTLETNIGSEVTLLTADATRLQQVIWNLLSNAIKFTPNGGQVWLTLQQQNERLRLEVRDSGEGIDKDFLPFVFDRFRQADGSTTRRHGGLGLGLAIAQSVVEAHNGTIQAASEGAGKGACFTVELPVVVPQPEAESRSQSSTKTSAEEAALLAGMRVLIVDDHEDTRDLLRFILTEREALIQTAASVEEALTIVRDWQPHLVLSDLGMPDSDGYQLIKKLRSTNGAGQIPVVALTGYAMDGERMRALAMGFQGFLTKPVNPEKLIALLADFRQRRAQAAGNAPFIQADDLIN